MISIHVLYSLSFIDEDEENKTGEIYDDKVLEIIIKLYNLFGKGGMDTLALHPNETTKVYVDEYADFGEEFCYFDNIRWFYCYMSDTVHFKNRDDMVLAKLTVI